jgi:hypothetical protein
LVGDAMHAIDYVDSCDYGEGDDHEPIDKVFAFLGNDASIITKAYSYDALKEKLQEFFK